MLHNLRLAAAVLPGLGRLNIVRQWAGLEAVTADALPYLGAIPGHPGLFVATGTRGGWTLGPAIGRHMAEAIRTNTMPPAIVPFSPARSLVHA